MTLVLLHGFTGDSAVWDDVVARLPEGTPVHREALLGHGLPPAGGDPEDLAPRAFDGEVDRLAARLAGLAPAHLVGYSMGARVAAALACRHPALVGRLTLLGFQPGFRDGDADGRAERAAADERWARLLEAEGIAAFAETWEAQPLFATQRQLPEAVRLAHRARRRGHDPRGLALALRTLGLARMPDLRAGLVRLDIPVTLVAGALDARYAELATDLRAALRRGTARVVPDAGHDVVLEAPAAVAALLTRPEEDT